MHEYAVQKTHLRFLYDAGELFGHQRLLPGDLCFALPALLVILLLQPLAFFQLLSWPPRKQHRAQVDQARVKRWSGKQTNNSLQEQERRIQKAELRHGSKGMGAPFDDVLLTRSTITITAAHHICMPSCCRNGALIIQRNARAANVSRVRRTRVNIPSPWATRKKSMRTAVRRKERLH